jgi:hypothetical protein
MMRDMKNPGEKIGNDVWCDLTPEARGIIRRIFPCSADAICAALTRACYAVGINTEEMPAKSRLHFHDLPHDGVSRLLRVRVLPVPVKVADHWETGLLRPRRQRPSRRAAKARDKFAPSHLQSSRFRIGA